VATDADPAAEPGREVRIDLLAGDAPERALREQQTTDLADELRNVRGVKVSRATGDVPEGAKGVDLAAIGELIVSLGGAGGAVNALVGVLRSWITRGEGRKIRVTIGDREIVLEGASRDSERDLVALFEREAGGG
jgi:hypothetical protein